MVNGKGFSKESKTEGVFVKMLAVLIAFFGVMGVSQANGQKQVMVTVADALVPSGFDSTSDAYVVVSGMFPNGCYRWSKAEVAAQGDNIHEVRSFANVQPGMCLTVLMPFTREVRLGQLEQGNHKIRFMNGDGVTYLEKSLVVE